MKIIGIVAEYNPFHLGHSYHLNKARETIQPDGVIAVLSGNFLQRGEPAFVDKWARTQMALKGGIDLVLELPTVFACRSAFWFATGAIKTLESTGIVSHLAFGAETNNLSILAEMANLLNTEPPEFKNFLAKYLNQGLSYPQARNLALESLSNNIKVLGTPNNILAIAYLRSLQMIESQIEPVLIKRKGNYHSSNIEEGFMSASAIRHNIANDGIIWQDHVPLTTKVLLEEQIAQGKAPVYPYNFSESILAIIRRSSPDELKNIIEMEEGLENRVFQVAQNATSLNELIAKLKTKRYTQTRIQRLITHILINFKQDFVFNEPQYLRVLGFNNKGKEMLKLIKAKSQLPIITKFAHGQKKISPPGQKMLELEIRSTDIYALGFPSPQHRYGGQDFYRSPISIE